MVVDTNELNEALQPWLTIYVVGVLILAALAVVLVVWLTVRLVRWLRRQVDPEGAQKSHNDLAERVEQVPW